MKTYTKILVIASFLISVVLTISPNIIAFTCNKKTVCDELGFQYHHNLCSDDGEEGGAFITWSGSRNGSDYNIYAQRIDANGKTIWNTNGIAVCREVGNQFYPRICNDGEGGAIIVWSDYRNDPNFDIYAQRIDADGNQLWNPNGTLVSSGNSWVQVRSDNNGGAIFSWDTTSGEYDPFDPENDIFAQRIDSNGTKMWGTNGIVICNATSMQTVGDFFCDEEGNSFFTWIDYRDTLDGTFLWDNSDIYAQKVDINGGIQWQPNGTAVCTLSGPQWPPQICTDGVGGVIINWIDAERYQCFGQRLNSTGEEQWGINGTVLVDSVDLDNYGVMMSDGEGGAVIIVGSSEYSLSALKINSTADIIFFEEIYNNEDEILTRRAQICSDGEGGTFITWTAIVPSSSPGIPDELDILAQRIDSNGTSFWPLTGKVICDYPGHQYEVQICNNGVGSAIISWERWFPYIFSPLDIDIYFTLLGKDGNAAIFFSNFYLVFIAFSILALIITTRRHFNQSS